MDIKLLEMGFSKNDATRIASGEDFECDITLTANKMMLTEKQTVKLMNALKVVGDILADGLYQLLEQKIKEKEGK